MRPQLSFANVVSCLALFVALGGTSYAVIKLPRNSVGSREVKDGSLRAADLAADAAKRGPRGSQGPAGPSGGFGPAGPPGPRGASDVVTAFRNAIPMSLGGPSSVDVVTLNLPAGSWSLAATASAVYFGPGSDFFRCGFTFAGKAGYAGTVARIGADTGGVLAGELAIHEGRVLSGPTPVRLTCGHDINLPSGTPRIDHAQITATRTDNLDIQAG